MYLIVSLILFIHFGFNFNITPNELHKEKDSKFGVNYIGEITTSANLKQESSFFSKVFEMIVGKDVYALNCPISLIAEDTSRIYILDQGNRTVSKLDMIKNEFGSIEIDALQNFPSLVGICKDDENNYYFSDSKLNKIYYFNEQSISLSILNDSLKLNKPTGIAFCKYSNEFYITETDLHRIIVLDKKGNVVRTIGKRGILKGEFNFPISIWISDEGFKYIVDAMNFRIQILNDKDEVVSVFGQAGDASGYFGRPKGIAIDSYGNIYVVDALFNTVQIFDKTGNFLYNFGKVGKNNCEFWLPNGIYIDKGNKIYVADSYNSRIQIFQLVKRESDEK